MARTHLGLVILAGTTLFAPTAAAEGPRTLFGQPVNQPPPLTEEEIAERAANLPAHLEQAGLTLVGTQIIPTRLLGDHPEEGTPAWDEPVHRATTFLNFFGGELKYGTNASEGQSPCVQGKVDYPGYGGTEQKALAIIQVFKDAAEPFGMRIAYEKAPPKELPHSQVMMGGTPQLIGLPQGVLGVACNLDCGDIWWRDTTFAFTEESNDVNVLGTTALQEAAHAWGLDHIDGQDNIMYPFATPGSKVWADTCTPYNDATGPIGCKYVHKEFCPEGSQNDVSELNAYFGPNSPDTVPPTVVMTAPTDGQVFESGEGVSIAVSVTDDYLGFGWKLVVPELDQELPVYDGTTAWNLVPPDGAYTVRVEAIDHDGNVGFAEAKIYVGVEPEPEPMSTSGEESGEESGNSPTEQSGGESDGETDPQTTTDPDMMGDDKGCSCRTEAPPPVWLLGLGLLVGARRRRR
jgi:MYXO-CTERM domain-containing protein